MMKATALQIHNFRSIADAAVELTPYSLLVGPNNAGKSNIIAALRVFYEKGLKFESARDFPKYDTADRESWIEVEYRPNTDELAQLKSEYIMPGGVFRVRKYLQSSEKDDEGKTRDGIYAYIGGELSGSRFYGAKNVQQGKLGDVIFIPAVSKIDEHTKMSGPSALRDLINTVLKGILANSGSYQSLVEAFGDFGSRLKKEATSEGHSLDKLESQVSEDLAEWGAEFELLINAVAPEDIVKTLVSHQVLDGALGKPLDPGAFGQGFQRHLIFSLIRLASAYESKKPSSKKEFSPNLTWILFEEPEAFLHPSQMETLDRNLRSYSAGEGQQVIICSHSAQFASLNVEDLPGLIRVNREGATTRTGQICSSQLERMLEANHDCVEELRLAGIPIADEDTTIDMESIKYSLWLDPARSSAFFAQRVLLVEGPSERALLNLLINEKRIRIPRGGVAVIDTLGKWNTHRFVNLLGCLRIPHAVLYDRDGGKLQSIALEKALAASANEFTLGIDHFDMDLEAFLEIGKPAQPNRKPQVLIWNLKKAKIPVLRLEALIAKVEALCAKFETVAAPAEAAAGVVLPLRSLRSLGLAFARHMRLRRTSVTPER